MKQPLPPRAILPMMPVVLVVSAYDGAVNVATHGQICTLSSAPPSMGVSVGKSHRTAQLISQSGFFSVNVPTTELIDRVLLCGGRAAAGVDKSSLFHLADSGMGVPVIDECPVSLVCAVRRSVELEDSILFIGEVVQAWADPACLTEGTPDAQKCRTLLCSLDGRFFGLGDHLQ